MYSTNREPTVYCPKPRGQSSGELESLSMVGNLPSSTSARTIMSSSEERSRPAPLNSLSVKTARPSMNQIGCSPLVIQSLPKMSLVAAGRPRTVSRCRMCVYSWLISSKTLSSKSASVERESGGAA